MKPNIERLTTASLLALCALQAAAHGGPESRAHGQHDHDFSLERRESQMGSDATGLLKVVRQVSRRFHDASAALEAGYVERFGCVSHSDAGAMGVHFVNDALVADGILDARQPEIIVYEPQPNGKLRLVAVDYLITSEAWHASNDAPPELMGQLFHLFESPNRFGLPEFYTLHVWAWKDNPWGAFSNWNPRVSCAHYSDE